jgi:uncharacterized protein DUF397
MQEQMQSHMLCTAVFSVCDHSGGRAGLPEPMDEREMPHVTHGMLAALLGAVTWRKSKHSNPYGNCVELAGLAASLIAVRNSRHPGGPVLICSHTEMAAFLHAVREGGLDGMTG